MYQISLAAGELNHDYVVIKCTASGAADSLVTFRMNSNDVNDVYSRLGAPAGASVSADVAAVKTDTGDLSTNYTATRAAKLDNADVATSTRSSHSAADAGTDAASKVLVTPANKLATMAAGWAVTPDNTSQFVLLPLGTIPGATAPSAATVADTVLDELAGQKVPIDRSTGDVTAYKPDETTVRGTRRITEIDANTQGLIPQP